MSEVYRFNKHENNEKNRKNAAFSFLKNIKLGNEPLINKEKKSLINEKRGFSRENSFNNSRDNEYEKDETKSTNSKPKFFIDDGSDNESNSSNSKEHVSFSLSSITENQSQSEFNKEACFINHSNYTEINRMADKPRRNMSSIINRPKINDISAGHNFKTLWSNRRNTYDSQVFGRIHSLSDLTELSKQDKSNTLSMCGKSNSGDNMIRKRQSSINIHPAPVTKDKRQRAAKKFLSNIQLVPPQTNKIAFKEKEIRKLNFNGYNRETSLTSNYLSIKGSQLKNYENENKDDHEKELFNTVLNNIQVYTSPNGNIIGTFSVLNPRNFRENRTKIMSMNRNRNYSIRNNKKDISFKLPNIQIRKRVKI
ncbi:hypothetical protein BCR36DRAFT_50040 [Piromyces finnis]|uniref:Uncharacterized protein n=1 Tax=Piromyces finnis TaxID=1754191 RepID=A0A1Y1VNS9_9FUNG|nr:hypothetical protein BCR36DRAFT_50040 [Piromyces finnis]|eukprot:ORX60040.1 hypothetical protein BCR36DRAFT_50040 [Piromyces finnis]